MDRQYDKEEGMRIFGAINRLSNAYNAWAKLANENANLKP